MHGLVNRGLQDLALQLGGEQLWDEIRGAADAGHEAFIGMDSYPDDVTYALVDAASRVLRISPAEVLHAFGKHWIKYTARHGYGAIFETMGRSLPEFLGNLDAMHARVSLSIPELRTPSFVCEQRSAEQLRLEYWSDRSGLAPMVLGLLDGLGDLYGVTLTVTHSVDRARGADHDEFVIDYRSAPSGRPRTSDRHDPLVVTSAATPAT